jgi:N-acetylmuramoyl-L-alanine amidase
MKIKNHRLVEHWYQRSKDAGGALNGLRFIVLHYTAGGAAEDSRDYMLKSPAQKQAIARSNTKVYASAHVIVGRDGAIWQIVPFNLKARHAGTSRWKGLTSLNQYSIGIEIANYGWLNEQGDGTYKRPGTPRFEAKDVTVARMPGSTQVKGWENYTERQLDAVEHVARSLLGHYATLREILGHEEISPGRKFDPGPAFPLQRFKNLAESRGIGALERERGVAEPEPERFLVTTRLNIRGGPGIEHEPLEISPLAAGTKVVKLDHEGAWYFVCRSDDDALRGWVHSRYLELE